MAKLDQPVRPMMRRPAGLSPTRHRGQRSKTPAACCSGSPWRPRRVLKQKLPLSGVSSLLTTLSFAKRYRSAGLRPRRPRTTLKKFAVGPVKSILHSQRNGGFGTHFGPSRGALRRRAIRPTGTCSAAICYVRSTSILLKNPLFWRQHLGFVAMSARQIPGSSPHVAKMGVGSGMSFASFRRFWAVAASRNSSLAPFGPRRRNRSSRRMRFR